VKEGLDMIMNCEKTRELMLLYMDNELEDEELKGFEEHLKSCESCRIELEEIAQVIELCVGLPEEDLPETFKEQLHKKLVDVSRQESSKNKIIFLKNRHLRAIVTAAAVFVVFVALSSIFGKDFIRGRFMIGSDKSAKSDMASESANQEARATAESADGSAGMMQSIEDYDVFTSSMESAEGEGQARTKEDSTGTGNDATRGLEDARDMLMMALPQLKEVEVAVSAEDVEKQTESIEKYGSRFGLEMLRKDTQSDQGQKSSKDKIVLRSSNGAVEIHVVVPNTEYDMFVDALNNDSELSKMLSFGEMKNVDVDEYINNLNSELDEINKLIEESEKSGDESEEENADRLAEERDGLKSIIDSISGNPNCTVVKFRIQKAG